MSPAIAAQGASSPRHVRMLFGDILCNGETIFGTPRTSQRACHPHPGIERERVERAQLHGLRKAF